VDRGNAGSEQVLDHSVPILKSASGNDGSVLEGGDPEATGQHQALVGGFEPVSVNLDGHEIPFQQSGPRSVLLDPASQWDWRRTANQVGRWPLAILFGLTVLAVMFAAFISRNSQSLSDDLDSRVAQAIPGSPAEAGSATDVAGGLVVSGVGSESGRSTGSAGDFGPIRHYSGELMESEEDLVADITWLTTTTAPATTSAPSTTDSVSSTTTPSSSTSAAETTTTLAPPEAPVAAVAPGRPAGQEPEQVKSGKLSLQAEARADNLRLRFKLYVRNEGTGEWELSQQSRWRRRESVSVDLRRYEGQVVGWSVVARQRDGSEFESEWLFVVVGEQREEDGD